MIPLGAGADVHRRRGQERHVPAAYLAARRHGGPDARVGADPCRDDGRGGRLPRGAHVPALCRLCARGAALDGLYRGLYGALCRRRGLRAERHQACAGVQYHFADRLHDRGAGRLHLGRSPYGRTGVHGLDVSPLHARHVQGAAVPRRRVHHPCRAFQRDVGHGRPAPIHARDACRRSSSPAWPSRASGP